jgi:thymidylate synthase (FAD)
MIKIKLLDYMGDDNTVCNAAWVSGGRQNGRTQEDKEKLIKYLADNNHETPFQHVIFSWHMKVPQRIGVQVLRHRSGTHNCASARYGHKFIETYKTGWPELVELETDAQNLLDKYNRVLEETGDLPLGKRRRIRELAAMCIPQGAIVEQIMTMDLRNLKNFFIQRLDIHAQPEIQEVARQMRDIVLSLPDLPLTCEYYLSGI